MGREAAQILGRPAPVRLTAEAMVALRVDSRIARAVAAASAGAQHLDAILPVAAGVDADALVEIDPLEGLA